MLQSVLESFPDVPDDYMGLPLLAFLGYSSTYYQSQ
jgi:hypothetical protein